ncbi:hypothetical protein UXP46_23740 [Enterobacter ludwigii]|uniref:hypothetical protein n=1 Tax=Enterobacter ludwigii TaxID=299767 RepID=UPI002FD5896F
MDFNLPIKFEGVILFKVIDFNLNVCKVKSRFILFRKNVWMLFVLLIISLSPHAKMMYLPMVTSTDISANGMARWTFSPVEVYVPDLEAERTLYQNEGFSMVYTFINRSPIQTIVNPTGVAALGKVFPSAFLGEKFSAYAKRMYDAGEMNFVAYKMYDGGINEMDCVGAVLTDGKYTSNGATVDLSYSNALSNALYSWQKICATLPPTNTYCDIESNGLDFDFGVLVASSAIGKKEEKNISFRCTGSTGIRLVDMSGGYVSLSNGGKVSLTDGGVLLDTNSPVHNVSADVINSLPITATIIDPGSAGDFYGSSVILLKYQ